MKLQTNLLAAFLMAFCFTGLPNLGGCDKPAAEHKETVTHPDGSQESKESKTVRNPDGTVTHEEKKTTTPP